MTVLLYQRLWLCITGLECIPFYSIHQSNISLLILNDVKISLLQGSEVFSRDDVAGLLISTGISVRQIKVRRNASVSPSHSLISSNHLEVESYAYST